MSTIQQIAEILDKIHTFHDAHTLEIDWKDQKTRAATLSRLIGQREELVREFEATDCTSCALAILNALRAEVGRPALYNAVTETTYQARIRTCTGDRDRPRCEHLSRETKFKPTFPFIQFSNANCTACGCFIHLKAGSAWFDCPLRKWPKAA